MVMGPGFPTASQLTGTGNFNAWNGIFFSYAEEKLCLEHIQGDPIKPTVTDVNDEKEVKRERQWRRDRGAARTLLIESVSEQIKEEVNDITKTPHELYKNLVALYGTRDNSAITRYENAFFNIKHVPGDNVDVVIRKMQTAHRQLTDAGGAPIDKEKYIRQLIGWLAMDDEWTNSCKKYLKKIGKASWTFERFRTELTAEQATFDDLKERKRQLARGPAAAATASVNNNEAYNGGQCAGATFNNNFSRNGNGNNNGSNRNPNRSYNSDNDREKEKAAWMATQECYNCKNKGHFARECGNPCGKCGKSGHGRKECRSNTSRNRNNANGGIDIAALAAAVAKINMESQPRNDASPKTKSGLPGDVIAMLAKNGYTVDETCKSITRTRIPAMQHVDASHHTHPNTTTFTENARAPAADAPPVTSLAVEYDKAPSNNTSSVDIKIDSCATDHFLTKDFEEKLKDYRTSCPKLKPRVTVGDGSKVPIIGEGNGSIIVTNDKNRDETTTLPLHGAKLVPRMAWNLASVRRITMSGKDGRGYGVYFTPGGATCKIIEQPTGELGGKVVATGTASDNDPLYKITGSIALGAVTRSMSNHRENIAHTNSPPRVGSLNIVAQRRRPKSTVASNAMSQQSMEIAVKKDLILRHRQMGHTGEDRIKTSLISTYRREGTLTPKLEAAVKQSILDECSTCHFAAQKRPPVPGPPIASDKPLDSELETNEWLHTDMGSMGITGRNGETNFQIIVDGKDKMGTVLFLKSKETEELLPKFQKHIDYIQRQHGPGRKVKTVQSDGGEMTSGAFKLYFESTGIKTVVTPKGTPRRNAVAERRIGVLTVMALAMLLEARWPLEWWPEALRAANERYNMLGSTSNGLNGKSPYEMRYGREPDTSHLKVMFCPAYLLQRRDEIITEREKLAPHALRVVYTGTAPIPGQGYQVYDPVTKRTLCHEYVEFDQDFHNATGQGRVLTLANGQVAYSNETGQPLLDSIVNDRGDDAPQLAFPVDQNVQESIPTIAQQNVHLQWENGPIRSENANEREISNTLPFTDASTRVFPTEQLTFQAPKSPPQPQQQESPPQGVTTSFTTDTPHSRTQTPADVTVTSSKRHSQTPMSLTDPVTPQRLDYSTTLNTVTDSAATRPTDAPPPDHNSAAPEPTVSNTAPQRRSARIAATQQPSYNHLNTTGTTSVSANAAVNEWESGSSGSTGVDSSVDNPTNPKQKLPVDEPREPKSLTDLNGMSTMEQTKWNKAMEKEVNGLIDNKTWTLRPPPQKGEQQAIPGKWVWKLKIDQTTGDIEKYKARWVAMGCRMVKGRDFHETFAACPRMQTFRLFCSIANAQQLDINMEDVAQAYLQGTLDKSDTVLVKQPTGYEVPGKEDWVCELKKGLYGIAQAGRIWQKTIHSDLIEWGYKQNRADPCLYTKHDEQGRLQAMTVVWVDDMPNAEWPPWMTAYRKGSSEQSLSKKLANKYKTTSGPITQFCGMHIQRDIDKRVLHMSQTAMIDQLLEDYNMTDVHPVTTPMEVGVTLSKSMCPVTQDEIDDMKNVPYRQLVGSLGFIAQTTRPDIVTPVGKCARFVDNPGRAHWRAAKRVLSYLKGTRTMGITFKATGDEFTRDADGHLCMTNPVNVFCDSDYAADVDKRRSSTGYVVFVGGGPVSWRHVLQQSTALSTAEAETMAMCEAVQEAEWLRNVMNEMGIKMVKRTQIWEDNQAAIALAKDVRSGKRTKHMEVRWFFTRDVIKNGHAEIHYCNTKDMIADIMTKALPREQFQRLRSRLGVTSWGDENGAYAMSTSYNKTRSPDTVTSGSVRICRLRHRSGIEFDLTARIR